MNLPKRANRGGQVSRQLTRTDLEVRKLWNLSVTKLNPFPYHSQAFEIWESLRKEQ